MRSYKTFSLFMVSFLISAVILLIPTTVTVLLLQTTAIVPSQGNSSSYSPAKREDLTVLLAGKSDSTTIGTTILAKFSSVDEKITIAVVPSEIIVESGGRFDSLAGLWKRQGGEKSALALASALGVEIDRYALVDVSGFADIVDVVGRVEFDVKRSITLEGGGVAVNSGLQPLNGLKLGSLLCYKSYPKGEEDRLAVVEEIAVGSLNQRLPTLTPAIAEALFNVAVNLAETNITYNDFHFRKSAIQYLSTKKSVACSVAVVGSYNQAKNTFILTPESLEKIKKAFI